MEQKNVLILGNKGMLGHIVERYFNTMPEKYHVVGWNREHFDARKIGLSLDCSLGSFDYVINCVGILNTSDDIQLYSDVNVVFPKVMAKRCEQNGAKFIHISTNCVFAGIGPHNPRDIPDATDLYGRSKAMGEIMDEVNYTIRCSIIGTELKYEGTGLINQFVTNRNFDTGFVNVFWNGVTTLELAKWIEDSLELTGLDHYFTADIVNKHELLEIINRVFKLDKPVYPGYRDMHQSLLNGIYYSDLTIEEQLIELAEFNEKY